ncbi:OmpH family outer membrane protein [Deinococcus cavernae]|nr:OmpH family outer membrane protein [Deinococcus cavernae]
MKMNVKALAPVAVVAAFGLGTLAPHAQTGAQKVGFANVDALFAASPSFKGVKDLETKFQGEAATLDKQIKEIDAKGTAATQADKTKRSQLVDTYNAKLKDYDTQMKAKAGPVEQQIDKAMSDYAKANGFSIIMSRAVAQQSGLVVYADEGIDVTEAIKKNIK